VYKIDTGKLTLNVNLNIAQPPPIKGPARMVSRAMLWLSMGVFLLTIIAVYLAAIITSNDVARPCDDMPCGHPASYAYMTTAHHW